MMGIRVFAMIVIFGFLASCSALFGKDDPVATALKGLADCTAVETEAVICGTILAPDGSTPIVGTEIKRSPPAVASVSAPLDLVSKGVANDTHCLTDFVGKFACAGITEEGKLKFETSGAGVGMSFTAEVAIGAVTDAYGTTAAASGISTHWLAVQGVYDGVQRLLAQLKGCTLTGNTASPASLTDSTECTGVNLVVIPDTGVATTFSSLDNISSFNSIFVNAATDLSKYKTVLQDYVAQGGNLYFSDTAASGLTAAFPDKITFGDNSITTTGTVQGATIDYANLATFMGASTTEIHFDLPKWQPITSVASGVTTYISGDTTLLGGTATTPIAVGWKPGSGGCILYTSFHTEGASTLVPDQEKELKYLIQNIGSVCQ